MNRKIPTDAFQYYFGLGAGRSYQLVADNFHVTKQAVTNLATRESWQERVVNLERQAREAADKKSVETLESMNERHLKAMRVIQAKALEALKAYPITTAIDAVRALELGVKQERLIRGEPSDRTALRIEDVIKREYERWLTTPAIATEPNNGIESSESETNDVE